MRQVKRLALENAKFQLRASIQYSIFTANKKNDLFKTTVHGPRHKHAYIRTCSSVLIPLK